MSLPSHQNTNQLQGEYLGLADLQERWIYTRQGVHKITRSRGFPEPAFTLNRGRVRVWSRFDVEEFERDHPELFNADEKDWKVRRAFWAAMNR